METLKTEYCKKYGHDEFLFQFDPIRVMPPDLLWLASYIEAQVANGVVYKNDQTFQIGWTILRIVKKEEGVLSLWEPDFRGMPINFVESITNTLVHLRLQKMTVESVDLLPSMLMPSVLQTAITCSLHDDSGAFYLDRVQPSRGDSGWFVGCADPSHDHNDSHNLIKASLYELACTREELVPFMALPPGTSVHYAPGQITLKYGGQQRQPKKGSYLQARMQYH